MTASERYRTFLFTYQYEGADWSLEIKARDMYDAKARIAKLMRARYDGELMVRIPAQMSFAVKVIVWIQNLIKGIF